MTINRCSALVAGVVLAASGAVGAAEAADMQAPAPDYFNGFYFGAQAGYMQGTGSDTDLCIDASSPTGATGGCLSNSEFGPGGGYNVGDNDMDGVTVGGYLGYNYRIDSFVLGLEGDFNWDNAKGNNSILGELNYDSAIDWDASIRARLGFVVDERALLYVTGGPSWLKTEVNGNIGYFFDGTTNVSNGDDSTEFGWVLGAGAEYAITEHLSVKAEYLHGWYGTDTLDLASFSDADFSEKFSLKQDLQTNVVRAGIAYHFGGL